MTQKESKEDHAGRGRRKAIVLAAGVAAGGILATMLYPSMEKLRLPSLVRTKPPEKPDIVGLGYNNLPLKDPNAVFWRATPRSEIYLPMFDVGLYDQSSVKPFKTATPKDPVRVRVAYSNEWIAFNLEWKKPTADKRAIMVREFRDACAVLLAKYPAPPEARLMGTKDIPATILHWKADWQVDVEEGFQDLEKAFPNVSADVYPPMKESIVDGKPPKTQDLPEQARIKLAGWASGNPISQPKKATPVEKIIANGPGTITTAPTQDAQGWGTWKDGTWKVILAKKLKASDGDKGEIDLRPGNMYSAAFTVWFGNEGDRGARKNPSLLQKIYLQ